MNKKKLTIVITSLVLVLTMAVGGTLAYFTDKTEAAVNTFTVGNVDIELSEPSWNAEDEKEFKGNITPGNEIAKDPTVENTGVNDAYVRVFVTLTENEQMDKFFAAVAQNDNYADKTQKEIYAEFIDLSDAWTYVGNEKSAGDDTRTFEFRYNDILAADESTEPLFTKITIPADLDGELEELAEDFDLVIFAEAIQADNFDDASAAFEALNAQ